MTTSGLTTNIGDEPIICSSNQKCPLELPCCSRYGICGTGYNCIGGCNPKFSYQPENCVPQPVKLYPLSINFPLGNTLENLDQQMDPGGKWTPQGLWEAYKFIHYDKFLITPNAFEAKYQLVNYEFTYSGHPFLDPIANRISLRMPPRTKGSLITSTKEILYGKSSVTLRAGKSRGVVTAFVMISRVGDEIDFEFLGTQTNQVQSNYYYQGNLDYSKLRYLPVVTDNTVNYHTYEIDWREDRIIWSIDGQQLRTVYKKDTWDRHKKIYRFPQTPMRLEVAIWPGGDDNLPDGTAEWAGGKIDWDDDPELKSKGYFDADILNIKVQPYSNSYESDIASCIRGGSRAGRSGIRLSDINHVVMSYNPPYGSVFTEKSISWNCNQVFFIEENSSSKIHTVHFNR